MLEEYRGDKMFSIGDRIVHPMHGAGVVADIVSEKLDGEMIKYYALKLVSGEVTILVPILQSEQVGVRKVCSKSKAEDVIEYFRDIPRDEDKCWNRRYRENMLRIRSGDILEVSKVVKNLLVRNHERELSTGEKKMFASAKQILFSELSLALNQSCDEIEKNISLKLCL